MLGQPISMLIPEVVGFKLTGKLREGATATDLVLTVTQMLRKKGVVGKFVEFYGPGLDELSLADRATIANMAPEYGATCGFFPIDDETLRYLQGHRPQRRAASRWSRPMPRRRACGAPPRRPTRCSPTRSSSTSARSSPAWPARSGRRTACRCPQRGGSSSRRRAEATASAGEGRGAQARAGRTAPNYELGHGDVVIAAITSCTNTSNPSVMLGAGLRRPEGGEARPQGQAVGEDLAGAGLPGGHRLSGQGRACRRISTSSASTSSATAAPPASATPARCPSRSPRRSRKSDLVAAAVLSGNRNFEGRVNPQVRANYLASPPLVVAYALAGSHEHRPDQGAARHRQEGQAGLSEGHLADAARRSQDTVRKSVTAGDVPEALRRRLRRRPRLAQGQDRHRPDLSAGTAARPMCRTRPTSRAWPRRPARSATSRARGCWPCSATASPPTTSRPPARSRRTARPAAT